MKSLKIQFSRLPAPKTKVGMYIRKKEKESCPIAKIASLLGDEVVLLVIRDLLTGKKRFCELERSLIGVSTRTLTIKLNLLVEHAFVSKERFAERPPRVEYSLTKKGHTLKTIIDDLRKLGKEEK